MGNNKIAINFCGILLLILNSIPTTWAQNTMSFECENKSIRYKNGGDDHFRMVVLCPYQKFEDDKLAPVNIIDKNKTYLQERIGNSFLGKLKLEGFYVVDFYNPELVKYQEWQKKADKRVKYAYSYYFEIQDGMKYYLTTVYDSLGNLISPNQVPILNGHKDLQKLISACEAAKIGYADTLSSKPIEEISLQYIESLGYFVWQLQMAPTGNEEYRVIANNYLLLNANTGQIADRISRKVISSHKRAKPTN